MNIMKKYFSLIVLMLIISDAIAQGTPNDQYKQMGSIAAIAEACYGSKKIPEKLKGLVDASIKKDPRIKNLMEELIKSYNEAYFKGIEDMVIWNGTEQRYGKPYSCQAQDDVNLIRGFEKTILDNMH